MRTKMRTRIAVMIGNRREPRDVKADARSSPLETAGFPTPPVVADDVPRTATVLAWIVPETTPPVMMARDQVRKGDIPLTTEAVATVPATTAQGVAIESNKLSSHGIKYATTSITVATKNAVNA
jgi:hypothetical protein